SRPVNAAIAPTVATIRSCHGSTSRASVIGTLLINGRRRDRSPRAVPGTGHSDTIKVGVERSRCAWEWNEAGAHAARAESWQPVRDNPAGLLRESGRR